MGNRPSEQKPYVCTTCFIDELIADATAAANNGNIEPSERLCMMAYEAHATKNKRWQHHSLDEIETLTAKLSGYLPANSSIKN
jgi:hypothetical protein